MFRLWRMGYWSSNHPPDENLQSYRKSEALKNFTAFLDGSDRIEDDEEQVTDAIEDIGALFLQIKTEAGKNAPDESGPETNKDCFSHIDSVAELNEPVSFAARL